MIRFLLGKIAEDGPADVIQHSEVVEIGRGDVSDFGHIQFGTFRLGVSRFLARIANDGQSIGGQQHVRMEHPNQIFALQQFHLGLDLSAVHVHRAAVIGQLVVAEDVVEERAFFSLRSPEVAVQDAHGIQKVVERLHLLHFLNESTQYYQIINKAIKELINNKVTLRSYLINKNQMN